MQFGRHAIASAYDDLKGSQMHILLNNKTVFFSGLTSSYFAAVNVPCTQPNQFSKVVSKISTHFLWVIKKNSLTREKLVRTRALIESA